MIKKKCNVKKHASFFLFCTVKDGWMGSKQSLQELKKQHYRITKNLPLML